MRRTYEEHAAKIFFKRNPLYNERNKFKCTIYYIKIDGLSSIKTCNITTELQNILVRSKIPLHNVLELQYPYNYSLDTAVLYFKNCHLRNKTRARLIKYCKNTCNIFLNID